MWSFAGALAAAYEVEKLFVFITTEGVIFICITAAIKQLRANERRIFHEKLCYMYCSILFFFFLFFLLCRLLGKKFLISFDKNGFDIFKSSSKIQQTNSDTVSDKAFSLYVLDHFLWACTVLVPFAKVVNSRKMLWKYSVLIVFFTKQTVEEIMHQTAQIYGLKWN